MSASSQWYSKHNVFRFQWYSLPREASTCVIEELPPRYTRRMSSIAEDPLLLTGDGSLHNASELLIEAIERWLLLSPEGGVATVFVK